MSRALVLMYHQVGQPASTKEARFSTPPTVFADQMQWLRDDGHHAVGLDEIVAHVSGRCALPERSFHVTFDDGFVGVLEHALPVLQRLSIPATLYAVAERTGLTNDWMHTRGFPRRALLSAAQLRLLADEGVTIGSHTCSHARLPDIAPERAKAEIGQSKALLEDLLDRAVHHFAYPYGAFNAEVREQVIAAGYRSACSTRSGFNRPGEDPYLIRRIDVYGTDRLWQFRQKISYGMNDASLGYPLRYYLGRLQQRLGA